MSSRVIGVDENGLGPALGPLVATGVALEIDTSYSQRSLNKLGLSYGVGDSKATAGFGKMAHSEVIALAAIEHVFGRRPHDVDELLSLVGVGGLSDLQRPCPNSSRPQCWGDALCLPVFAKPQRSRPTRPKESVRPPAELWPALASLGVRLDGVAVAVCCPKVLNAAFAENRNKLDMDLSLFEDAILSLSRRDASHQAICGMVGGIRDYRSRFRRFNSSSVEEKTRKKGVSEYTVREWGTLRFEVDCDAHHFPVALASMIGKYVRECWMERMGRFYEKLDPALERVSGYHDPRTRRFIAQSAALRVQQDIATSCFLRDR